MGSGYKPTAAVLAILVTGLLATSAGGATKTWNATAAGDWSVAGNWDPVGAPLVDDDVVFSAMSLYSCTVNEEVNSIHNLTLASTYTGTLTLGANLHVVGTCLLQGGKIANNGHELHLRGSGDVLTFGGGQFTAPTGRIFFETASPGATVNIPAGGMYEYGYCGITFSVVGAISATFSLQGNLTEVLGMGMQADAGANITFNTNDFDIDGNDEASFETAAGATTTINFGSSSLYFQRTMIFRSGTDVVNLGSAQIETGFWWLWTEAVTLDPGTSSVKITRGIGVNWFDPELLVLPFYDLEIAAGAGNTIVMEQSIAVENDLTISSGTLDTGNTSQYSTKDAEHINVGGDLTVEAGATLILTHAASGTSTTLTLDGAALQTITDNTNTTWPAVVLEDGGSAVLAASFAAGELTVGTGATWSLEGNDLAGGDLANDGTIIQQGTESVTAVPDVDSGVWQITGSTGSVSGPFTIPNLAAAGADYFDLEIISQPGDVFVVGAGDLEIAGDLHLDDAMTLTLSKADTLPTLTVTGVTSGNGTKIDADNRVVIGGAAGNYLAVEFDGGIAAGIDTLNYVSLQNLAAPAGVTVDVPSALTWVEIQFSNLNATHAASGYYLNATGAAALTLQDVVFRDVLSGTDGDGVFDAATDPGTITTENVTVSPAVVVNSYALGDLGIGGEATDDPAAGVDDRITWAAKALSEVSIAASDTDMGEEGPNDGVFEITRTLSEGAILVEYTIGGSVSLTDYVTLAGSVIIADTEDSVLVTVTPVDDLVAETDETLTMTLVDADGYDLHGSLPTSADITLVDNDKPPEAFDLVSPAPDAFDVSTTPLFQWGSSAYAIYYTITVSSASPSDVPIDAVRVSPDGTLQYIPEWGLLLYDTEYTWNVTAHNDFGLLVSTSTLVFTTKIDDEPPTVVSTTPSAGSDDVSIDSVVTVVFNEAMDAASTAAAFMLLSGGSQVDGIVSVSGNTLTFTPSDDLDYGATYTIQIDDSATDAATTGNQLDGDSNGTAGGDYVVSFQTEEAISGFGSEVSGCAPGGPQPVIAALMVAGLALLLSRGRRARRAIGGVGRALAVLVVGVFCLAGCSSVAVISAATSAETESVELDLRYVESTAMLSEANFGGSDFPDGWSARGGLAFFMGATQADMSPRISAGGYYHFLENEDKRVEVGIDLVPDLEQLGQSEYLSFTGDYVGFLGEDGTFYWKAGGGGIYEIREDDSGLYFLLEAGGGMWFKATDEITMFVSGAYQIPMGKDGDVGITALWINAGFDF